MAVEGPQPLKWSFVAGGDLSSSQYKFVKLNSSGEVVVCAAITDIPIGVVQNKPTQGGVAEVVIAGITKIQGDVNLARGDQIGTSADGQAAAIVHGTATTVYGVGQCLLDNSTAGGLATCVIDCSAPGRAA